jgi:2-dehydro-3-deoxygluconokinase
LQFLRPHEKQPRILAIGEAMIEFAPAGDGLFKRGFAGDTLNTAWYLRALLPASFGVAYATRIGSDAVSNEFQNFVEHSGIAADSISRDPERTLGLYTISLEGAERRFSYWRENSAARRLADDFDRLAQTIGAADLVYCSGITLAVIGETGRANLRRAVAQAHTAGTRIAFDSNIRLRLWPDERTARSAIEEFLSVTDVALPSFDDEANLWKDRSPEATVDRLRRLGVAEIAVKNGASGATLFAAEKIANVAAVPVADVADTTAAGDSFNAAYLAARCLGYSPNKSCALGHELAGQVVRHRGALAPAEALLPIRSKFADQRGTEK